MTDRLIVEPGVSSQGKREGYFVCRPVNGKSVAVCWMESEDDARLLAAAPEMRALLTRTRAMLHTALQDRLANDAEQGVRARVLRRRIAEITELLDRTRRPPPITEPRP